MAWHLRKYETTSGRTSIHDESGDIFEFPGIRLNGDLFDKTNIATKSEISSLAMTLGALQLIVSSHINQNNIDITQLQVDVNSLYELLGLLGGDISRLMNDLPLEQRIITADGDTILVSSLIWSSDHAIRDIVVYRNGIRLTQDVTGGTLADYTKLDSTRIRLNNRAAREDDRFIIRIERSGLSSEPTNYFFDNVNNRNGRGIPTPSVYSVNSDRLTVWMNGMLLVRSNSIGQPEDQYEESSPSFVTIGIPASPSDVITFLHQEQSPASRFVQTGVTGVSLTIPSYVMGSDRLKVWRNGVLMNHQALGSLVTQYTETSTTTIDLAEAATSDEIFVFENSFDEPQFREDITGLAGTTISLDNSYIPGDQHLLVFRNGLLMYKSATMGNPVDRYSESSSNTIELEETATTSEVFTVIYL